VEATGTDMTTYRWSRAQVLRTVGLVAVGLGLLWLGVGLVSAWAGGKGTGLTVTAAVATAVALAGAVLLVLRPPRVLELSPSGYRTFHLRGGGVAAADWPEVRSVETRSWAGGPAVVVELSEGRTSVVPLALLGLRGREAQQEMHNRLNASFGYRRLPDTT
jgi:hypothetical protein